MTAGSPIGLLLGLTYGAGGAITNNVFVYGTVDTDSSPTTLAGAPRTAEVDTDASPTSLKNPSTSGNLNNRQGNQSANTGTSSGTLR